MHNEELLTEINNSLAKHNTALAHSLRNALTDALSVFADKTSDSMRETAELHEAGPTKRLRQNIAASLMIELVKESPSGDFARAAIQAVDGADSLLAALELKL